MAVIENDYAAYIQTPQGEYPLRDIGAVRTDQGTENAGKVLGIGSDGMVTPVDGTGGGTGGTGGTTNYNDLSNRPQINGITLTGNKTSSDLNLQPAGNYLTQETDPTVPAWAKNPTKPTYTAEEVGALPSTTAIPTKTSELTNDTGFVAEDNVHNIPSGGTSGQVLSKKTNTDYDVEWTNVSGGGTGGTTNYNDLTNKPTINGVTLEGNKTSADLNIQSQADPLAGKHILFAGDSLVSGVGWKGGFANCLQEDHPTAIITNVAEAGALLTYAPDRPWIEQQLQENMAGKDILIFDGGFNDLTYPGKVMGTVPDDIAFNSNPETVADAFATWLWLAREANPTMDIFYIIPCMYRSTQTSGINTSVGNEFAEILKTICGYYSVGVIDLRFNGRVPSYSPLGGTTNPYMHDSLHPNELGYRKLAPFIDHEICKCY